MSIHIVYQPHIDLFVINYFEYKKKANIYKKNQMKHDDFYHYLQFDN